jgi:protoheme IX farnesyltransferase
VTTIALLVAATLPTVIGMAGMLYLVGSTLAGLAFLAFAGALFIKRTRAHARAVFFASLVYVPVIYALMAIDKQ